MALTKAEKILKQLDERDAARKAAPPPAPATEAGPNKYDGMNRQRTTMLLDNIIPDLEQPREDFNEAELAEMATTIKTHGVLEPVRVRWCQQAGKWILIFGERRLRAAHLAGLKEIPCIFEEGPLTRDQLDEIQIIENIHREGLKPSEQAKWIRRYMARQEGRTQKHIAAKVRMSEATISNVLAAAELPTPILNLVDAGVIPVRVGADLVGIKDPVEQAEIAEKIVTGKMNRVEALAEIKTKKPAKAKQRRRAPKPSRTVRLMLDGDYTVTIASKQPFQDGEVRKVVVLALESIDREQGRAAA